MPFLPIILKWLADPRAWVGIAFAGVLIFAGLEGARLHHAKSDLKAARIELAAYVSAEKAAQAKAKAQDSQAAQITADAARRASDAQQQAQALTAITIKEIPHYVTPNADAHCTVPVGLVRLRDAAATGADLSKVPQPSSESNDAPSGVSLSDLAGVAVYDYGAARQNAEQLTELQNWIKAQQALANR